MRSRPERPASWGTGIVLALQLTTMGCAEGATLLDGGRLFTDAAQRARIDRTESVREESAGGNAVVAKPAAGPNGAPAKPAAGHPSPPRATRVRGYLQRPDGRYRVWLEPADAVPAPSAPKQLPLATAPRPAPPPGLSIGAGRNQVRVGDRIEANGQVRRGPILERTR